MEHISRSEEETIKLAHDFLKNKIKEDNETATIIGLVGDLGSGKTTFMKGVADFFHVKDVVISPTFVIQKNYEIPDISRESDKHHFKQVVHIDAYRIEDQKELKTINWEMYSQDKGNIIFIEWPKLIDHDLVNKAQQIKFEHQEENIRKITIE